MMPARTNFSRVAGVLPALHGLLRGADYEFTTNSGVNKAGLCMSDPERPAGAPGGAFPSTHWTHLLQASGGTVLRAEALDALTRRYWRSIREYLRARVHCDHTADDLTQEFFRKRVLEGSLLQQVDRARCRRFRSFLALVLDRFVIDEFVRKRAHREHLGQLIEDVPDPAARTAEARLDDAWRADLVSAALDRLERELRAQNKGEQFEVFRQYFLTEDQEPDYQALAGRFGVTAPAISGTLQRAKKRLREILREAVSETVDPEEVEEEWTWLFHRT